MIGPKVVGSNKICQKKVYTSGRNRRGKTRTTSFGEKGLFIGRDIFLGKQLLPQINNFFKEVLQNKEMTSQWSNHCWMLLASRKMTFR